MWNSFWARALALNPVETSTAYLSNERTVSEFRPGSLLSPCIILKSNVQFMNASDTCATGNAIAPIPACVCVRDVYAPTHKAYAGMDCPFGRLNGTQICVLCLHTYTHNNSVYIIHKYRDISILCRFYVRTSISMLYKNASNISCALAGLSIKTQTTHTNSHQPQPASV